VVFDLTKRSSFESLMHWIKELRANAEPDIVIMIVGNKLDLCTQDQTVRQITKDEADKFASQYNALYQETSAKENTNVKSAFELLMQRIL